MACKTWYVCLAELQSTDAFEPNAFESEPNAAENIMLKNQLAYSIYDGYFELVRRLRKIVETICWLIHLSVELSDLNYPGII